MEVEINNENADVSCSSVSQKRKIECENEGFEEKFAKFQRRIYSKIVAELIADDNSDSDSDIYEQMDWIENEHVEFSRNYNEYSSFENNPGPFYLMPKVKLKEDKRRLLRISLDKINGVDDLEEHLHRSVLINNTVKRLQNDSAFLDSVSTPNFEDNDSQQNLKNLASKEQANAAGSFGVQYKTTVINTEGSEFIPNSTVVETVSGNSQTLQFPQSLSFEKDSFSTESVIDKQIDPVSSRLSIEDTKNSASSVSIGLKQLPSLNTFSIQSCSFQYRNEESINELQTQGVSLLDSVVYHGLIASLES